MKKIFIHMLFITTMLFLNTSHVFAREKIKIVTTIGQITNVTEEIGGEFVKVSGLMGAGVDPHLYKATESDVNKLANADIILYNGLFLEAKMEDILKQLGRKKVTVAVGEAIEKSLLLNNITYAEHYDPHIWFDVELWTTVAERITAVLADYDPVNKESYEKRAQEYIERLKKLHQYIQTKSSELPDNQRVLITAHDAFRYFGRKYHFEVIGLQGISTASEAGTKDVMALADLIASRKIRAVFIESSVPERNIKAVQEAVRARGWEVKIGGELFSDAMGDANTFEGTYIGMVTHNINTIVNALKESQ